MFNEHISLLCLCGVLFLFLFFLFCGLFWVVFPIETMDGVLRLMLLFGIFNAKLVTIAMETPVFFQIQSYKRAAEGGIPTCLGKGRNSLGVLLCGQVVKMLGVL